MFSKKTYLLRCFKLVAKTCSSPCSWKVHKTTGSSIIQQQQQEKAATKDIQPQKFNNTSVQSSLTTLTNSKSYKEERDKRRHTFALINKRTAINQTHIQSRNREPS
ncbi:hypothetical protein V6Z12_D08G177700 [Gossypium hirsutum]